MAPCQHGAVPQPLSTQDVGQRSPAAPHGSQACHYASPPAALHTSLSANTFTTIPDTVPPARVSLPAATSLAQPLYSAPHASCSNGFAPVQHEPLATGSEGDTSMKRQPQAMCASGSAQVHRQAARLPISCPAELSGALAAAGRMHPSPASHPSLLAQPCWLPGSLPETGAIRGPAAGLAAEARTGAGPLAAAEHKVDTPRGQAERTSAAADTRTTKGLLTAAAQHSDASLSRAERVAAATAACSGEGPLAAAENCFLVPVSRAESMGAVTDTRSAEQRLAPAEHDLDVPIEQAEHGGAAVVLRSEAGPLPAAAHDFDIAIEAAEGAAALLYLHCTCRGMRECTASCRGTACW